MTGILAGLAVVFAIGCYVVSQATDSVAILALGGLAVVIYNLIGFTRAGFSARMFMLTAAGLSCVAVALNSNVAIFLEPLSVVCFVGAFFTALGTLQMAAGTSPAIVRCGRYFATQPPGRRYAALTLAGHLFGIVLNFGAISLLGTMVERSVRGECSDIRRTIRLRRMLLAIQRGLLSMLSWCPIGIPIALSTTLVPGASWSGLFLPGAVISILMVTLGYGLDRLDTPTVKPVPHHSAEGTWRDSLPLLVLLGLLLGAILAIEMFSGLTTAAAAIVVVPFASFFWIAVQGEKVGHGSVLARIRTFVVEAIPDFRTEIIVLTMGAFIGTLGAGLLKPYLGGAIPLGILPPSILIAGIVIILPLGGQVGVSPILATSLIAPLLPDPASMGLSPSILALTFVSAWLLTGASSPFTANTMLISRIAGVSARHIGLSWNGRFSLFAGATIILTLSLMARVLPY